jgi:hypothetical protein
MSERGSRLGPREPVRAQSNAVAAVLLVGMVLTGATVVVYAGTTALDEREQALSYSSAKESMQSFDTAVARAANGDQSGAAAPLDGLDGGFARLDDDAGQITIEVIDRETGSTVDSNSKQFGAVVYEREGRTVAYQGGGVFTASGGGSAVVSAPPVEYRTDGGEPTLTLPVIAIKGDSIHENAKVSRTDARDLLSVANPVPRDHRVVITVQSEYYRAWGSVFEERIGASVTYNDAAQTVSFELVRPGSQGGVGSVVISSDTASNVNNHGSSDSYDSAVDRYDNQAPGDSGDIRIDGSIEIKKQTIAGALHATDGISDFGNGGQPTIIEGETRLGTSSDGELEITAKDVRFGNTLSTNDSLLVDSNRDPRFDGKVIVGGDLGTTTTKLTTNDGFGGDVHVHGNAFIGGNTDIAGDLVVNGSVDLGNNVDVGGDLIARDSIDGDCDSAVDGNVVGTVRACDYSRASHQIDAPLTPQVPTEPHAKDLIQRKRDAYDGGDNDNDDDTDIASNSLTCAGDCTLERGSYYFDSLDVDSVLTLDTVGGDIEIYVDDEIDISNDITVKGPNEVRIYTAGDGADSFYLDSDVIVRDQSGFRTDRSKKLWVYTMPDADVHIHTGSTFTGVIYGAADDSTGVPGASITVRNNVDVYGALVGHLVDWSNHGAVHYDEALRDETVLDRGVSGGPPKIAYIQSTSRTVTVG